MSSTFKLAYLDTMTIPELSEKVALTDETSIWGFDKVANEIVKLTPENLPRFPQDVRVELFFEATL